MNNTLVQNKEDLWNRIFDLCAIIENAPGIFGRVRNSMMWRIDSFDEVEHLVQENVIVYF